MRRFLSVFLSVVSVPIITSSAAHTYLVRPDGSGDFPTIQAAIDAAWHGDVIELADGIFLGQGNRNLHFDGKALTLCSQSGNPEACTIDPEGYAGASNRALRFDAGEQIETVVDGITVTGSYMPYGGAINCSNGSSPRFANCRFIGNEARNQGGVIFCTGGSSPVVEDCRFIGNLADSQGGAVFCEGASSPSFTNCTFEENSLTGDVSCSGGAIYISTNCDVVLVDCVFRNNEAEYGGAVACASGASPTIRSCLFDANSAGRAGGGAVCNQSSPIFESCLFQDNTAGTHGGGMRLRLQADVLLTECVFLRNDAGFNGGALYSEDSDLLLEFSTLAFNGASSGGGIFWAGNSPTLTNVIIAHSVSGQSVFCIDPESVPRLSCCNLYGNAGGDWGVCIGDQLGIDGNFSADPLFCGSEFGSIPMLSSNLSPVTLRADSPCLPGNHPDGYDCGLIGARGVGCAEIRPRMVPTPWDDDAALIEVSTWGKIRLGYE